MAEEKDTKIKVTDRRKFNPDGTPREQADAAEPQAEPASPESQPAPAAPPAEDAAQSNVVSFPGEAAKKKERPEAEAARPEAAAPDRAGAQPDDAARAQDAQARAAASAAEQAYNQMKGGVPGAPEASFLGLLDMLAGEAAMCLGMVKNPSGAEIPIDLDAARQIIDMLAMLQRKTADNLDAEEKDVLENILAYLRMQFVSLSRNK